MFEKIIRAEREKLMPLIATAEERVNAISHKLDVILLEIATLRVAVETRNETTNQKQPTEHVTASEADNAA